VRREPERGYAEIARRYLAGHGPADPRDLAKWLAAPLGEVRRALALLGSRVAEVDGGLVELAAGAGADGAGAGAEHAGAGGGRAVRLPPPRLLGAFEPLLLGWRSRREVLGGDESAVISGGVFRGIGLSGGRAVDVWRFAADGVDFTAFGALGDSVARALERDAAAVLRFLGR
jgi:hypothetical protein